MTDTRRNSGCSEGVLEVFWRCSGGSGGCFEGVLGVSWGFSGEFLVFWWSSVEFLGCSREF